MKNNISVFLAVIILVFSQLSCNSGSGQNANTNGDSSSVNQAELPDYSGIYKTTDDNLCKLSITIEKVGQEYKYKLSYNNVDYTGKMVFENQDNQVYFTFDGKIEENEPKSFGGQLMEGAITIQNYGNSMNEYHYFKKCDEKYLEFKKS